MLKRIISCFIIVMGISGCSLIPDKIAQSEEIVRTVEIEEVKKERNPVVINYLGAVIVNNERMLFADAPGTVDKIHLTVGEEVKKDDELLIIKENNNNTHNINTDIDGYIKDVLVESYTVVEAGDPLVTISGYNHRVTLGITAKDIKEVEVGMKANVILDGNDIAGRVCFISPYPDEESRTFPAQIELSDTYDKEDYIVGAITEIELLVGEEEGIYLDINNVRNEGNSFVFIVDDDNRALKQEITIANVLKNNVRVDGLNEGDKVILSGASNLKEGQRVKILDKDEVGD